MFSFTQFQSLRFGFGSLVVLLGATVAQADHQWSQSAQREQLHQQYLSPVEHQALHRGLGDGYSYQQPTYRPAVNQYARSRSYGGNSGFDISISTGNGNYGYGNGGYGNYGYGGYGNQYQTRPSYNVGRPSCGSQNYGYGNSGYSQQHGQYGGYLR